jgi:thiol-disulfide isomerase/thioredoxin
MFKKLFFLSTGIFICSCIHKEQDLSKQGVRIGTAKITGEIINYPESLNDSAAFISEPWDSILFIYNVPYPVTNEKKTYRTQLQKDGSFSFEIPLECRIATGISFDDNFAGLYLSPNEELKVRIEFSDGQMNVRTNNPVLTFSNDSEKISSMIDFLDQMGRLYRIPPISKPLGERSLSDYAQANIMCLDNLRKQIDTVSDISDEFNGIIFNVFKMADLLRFMNYEKATRNYWGDSIPPQLDISYYKFLKSYDLNDPGCLYALYYSDVLQEILSNEVFAIPPIEDRAIEEWLAEVGKTMADLTGSEKGLFYDMLAANAYARQFNERLQPLSEKQRQHIQAYFSNRSFSEILLKKNEETEKMTGIAAHLKINETATLPDGRPVETYSKENKNPPDGKLIDSIVSKYKGKIVVIDFWATWCAPCMAAMSESRELKAELLNKEVVFVYITNRSSPMELWKRKIPGIGGEHYYLNRNGEWESISRSKKYGFEGIPTYLIFDAEGNLKSKLTGYPGNDKFKRLIDELL